MKTVFRSILLLAVLATLLPSCRKGKDDPLFSLRTRDARLKGTWVLTSAESNETFGKLNNADDATATFDGQTMTIVTHYMNIDFSGNVSTGTYTQVYNYSYELTFEKDGHFSSVKKTVDADGTSHPLASTGQWFWENRQKTFLKIPGESPDMISEEDVYSVERLSNKDLVLTVERSQGAVGTHVRLIFKKK